MKLARGWHQFALGPFCLSVSTETVWFSLFGWGLHVTRTPALFSERNGFERRVPLPFGWRLGYMAPGRIPTGWATRKAKESA